MRILAFEAAYPPGSVALAQSTEIVAFERIQAAHLTTASFAPLIQTLLHQADWAPHSIQLVATTVGPGSFTGTRIGVTAAKVFAYAVGAEVIGINTLELIASQQTIQGVVNILMDAQREQLFHAQFTRQAATLQVLQDTHVIPALELAEFPSGSQFAGPAAHPWRDLLPQQARLGTESASTPRADALAQLAYQKYHAGERHQVLQLSPRYYRKSAAEEKADAAARQRDTATEDGAEPTTP